MVMKTIHAKKFYKAIDEVISHCFPKFYEKEKMLKLVNVKQEGFK